MRGQDGWRPSGGRGHTEVTIERWRPTHRLLNSGGPALVQHWPALCLVDLEAQGEADGSDVVGRVLQPTNKQTSSAAAPWLTDVQNRRNSRKRGREARGRRFGPCEPGRPAGSGGGSCHQTAPAQTASCHPGWRKPRGLRRKPARQAGGRGGGGWDRW